MGNAYRFGRVLAICVAVAASPLGCSSDGDGGIPGNMHSRLTSMSGSIAGLGGAKAKLTAIVGAGGLKRQIPAALDAQAGTFRFEKLPEGPKTIVVEQGGKTRTVKFGVSKEAAKRTAVIPETQLSAESFDLGELSLSAAGDFIEAQRNPLAELVDTDADGVFDFFDDDLDGDGLLNWDDDALFGDWDDYADWGWDDEDFFVDDWDCDGDGIVDWEDWDIDLSADACGWEEDWNAYWEDEYWDDYDDGYWDAEYECLDPADCEDWEGGEWDDGEWDDGEWDEECFDPEFCGDEFR